MKLISPTYVEVDIGDTLKPNKYIGMCRCEILNRYLRDRAISYSTKAIEGLVTLLMETRLVCQMNTTLPSPSKYLGKKNLLN